MKKISKQQRQIHRHLVDIFPGLDILLNDTNTIYPLHLDIYIPSLKIGIEYDGEYWHYSDWAIKNGALKRMMFKDNKCIKKKILLLRIREKEWVSNDEFELQKIIDVIYNRNT